MLADPPEVEAAEDEPGRPPGAPGPAETDPLTDLRLVLAPGSLLGDLVGRVGRPMFTHETKTASEYSEIENGNNSKALFLFVKYFRLIKLK